jgi:transcriptional regulator with XRE-family HTH domain
MRLTSAQLATLRRVPGSRIRAAREMLRLTQVELCQLMDLPQSSLSALERNHYQHTTVARARRFAEFFGCPIEDLFPAREAVAS